MSTDLERYAPMGAVPEPADLARWVGILVPASQLAERIAGTEFVPKAMRGKPEAVTAAIMYGDEIGVGPMQALAGIHVVEGKPQPSAELMRALILRAGHTITVHDMTGQRVRLSGLREGRPESERAYVEWTVDMARSAGLLSKDNWRKYPRAMLLARATGDLARMLFPDVIKGLGYVAEDDVPDLGLVPEDPEPEQPAPKAVQRRTRPRKATVDQPPTGALVGPRKPPDDAPIAPRPPAPTRVDPTDVPLPDMPEAEPPPQPEQAPPEPDPGTGPTGTSDPEQRPPPEAMGEAPRRALMAKFAKVLAGRVDRQSERPTRLAILAAIVGHHVESSTHLTRAEGYRALEAVSAIERGDAAWDWDPSTGAVVITDTRPPPEDPWQRGPGDWARGE